MTSPRAFEAKVGSFIRTWWRHIDITHSLRFTSSATTANLFAVSKAAQQISYTYLCPGTGWTQANALPSELCRFGVIFRTVFSSDHVKHFQNVQNTTEELEERVEVLEMTVALLGEDVNRVEDDIDNLQIETGVLTIDLEGN